MNASTAAIPLTSTRGAMSSASFRAPSSGNLSRPISSRVRSDGRFSWCQRPSLPSAGASDPLGGLSPETLPRRTDQFPYDSSRTVTDHSAASMQVTRSGQIVTANATGRAFASTAPASH
jgi:hypothetical protein